jgi:uncharacterized protein (TIGR03067 family)
MSARFGIVVVFGLVFAASLPAEEKSDQDKIQGKWKIDSGIRGGNPLPEDITKSTIIVFDGNKMKMTFTREGQEQNREMSFKLDPTAKPKAIDVDINGKPGLGIYSLEGDTLKICHGEEGDARPTELASKEGTKVTLIVLKRTK